MNSILAAGACLGMVLLSPPALAAQDAGPSSEAKTAPASQGTGSSPETKMILNRPMNRAQLAGVGMLLGETADLQMKAGSSEELWEKLPVYLPTPPPRDVSEKDVAAGLKECKTFFVEKGSSIKVTGDLSSLPNHEFTDVQVQWEQILDEQGRPGPFQRPDASTGLIFMSTSPGDDDAGIWSSYPQLMEGATLPDRFEGWQSSATATFRVPVQFRTLSFKPSDLGTTQDDVTLLEWKHGRVVLEDKKGRLGSNDAGVMGFSAHGLRLSWNEMVYHPVELGILRKLAQTPWEQIPPVVPVPADWNTRVIRTFEGDVSRLEIYFVERRAVHEVRLQLLPTPGSGLVTSRYVSPPGRTLCEVTPKALAKQVRIFATRSASYMSGSFGQPLVVALLPPCVNSAWAQVKFEGLKYFRTSGQPIASVKTESRPLLGSFASGLWLAPMDRPAATRPDGAFPALARVKGKAQLAFPRLRVVTFSREASQVEGALFTLNDKTVTLRLPRALGDKLPPVHITEGTGWFAESPLNPLVGYDAAGRRLRPLYYLRQEAEAGTTLLTASFAGTPDRVELLLAGEQVRITLPFNVKLPPAPKPSNPDER